MASKVQFDNAAGYKFEDNGVITAVLDASGKLSLRDENSSLEVFENWSDFVKSMGDAPVAKGGQPAIIAQLEGLGLGKCTPIDRSVVEGPRPRNTEKETQPVAKKEAATAVKKTSAAKNAAPAKGAKKPAPAKKEKAPVEMKPCPCGCGGQTKSNFVMGHDARMHGWAKKIGDGRMKFSEVPAMAQKWLKDHGVKQGTPVA